MKTLNEKYVKVYTHKGYDIYTLKTANPGEGDNLGYIVNDLKFLDMDFNLISDAIKAIDDENKKATELIQYMRSKPIVATFVHQQSNDITKNSQIILGITGSGSQYRRKLDIVLNACNGKNFTVIDDSGELREVINALGLNAKEVEEVDLGNGSIKYIFNPIT